jgi:tuftelin-interacting protein 11
VIVRLQQVHLVVDDIESQAKEMKSSYDVSLEPFSVSFEKLIGLYPNEFDRYRLDEVVVAAIAPVVSDIWQYTSTTAHFLSQVRRMLTQWHPLEDPTAFVSNFRLWRKALRMTEPEEPPVQQVQVYGSSTVISSSAAM